MLWRKYAAKRAKQITQLAKKADRKRAGAVVEVFVRGQLIVALAEDSEVCQRMFNDREARHVGSFNATATPLQVFGRIIATRAPKD